MPAFARAFVKIDPQKKKQLIAVARAEHASLSQFVRRRLFAYTDPDK